MNPITKALSDISFRIPKEILIEVFAPKTFYWDNRPINYEEQIKNLVIRSRVAVDCDLVGGTEVFISLWHVPAQSIADDRLITVYRIPKEKTQGRSIISVLSMSYISPTMAAKVDKGLSFTDCSATELNVAGMAVMDSFGSMPNAFNSRVQLIGENVVMVKDTIMPSGTGLLRCVLGNDENMSHIQVRSFPFFSRLCELATKAYIYNNYTVTLDRARIEAGAEIGRFKEIVDSYADAEEMYQDYLKNTWQKVAFMNDRESFERFTRMMVGAYR